MGKVKLTAISPGARLVLPGPVGTSSTARSRRPSGPCTVTLAPAATRAGTLAHLLRDVYPSCAVEAVDGEPPAYRPIPDAEHELRNVLSVSVWLSTLLLCWLWE